MGLGEVVSPGVADRDVLGKFFPVLVALCFPPFGLLAFGGGGGILGHVVTCHEEGIFGLEVGDGDAGAELMFFDDAFLH